MAFFDSLKQRLSLIWAAFFKPMPQEQLWQRANDKQSTAKKVRLNSRLNAKQGSRILIIDDSKTVLAFLGGILKQNGYEVFKALDAETGVELALSDKPDMIFLDIVLPGMSGFAALRLLRRGSTLNDVPVIMMSGNAEATEEFYIQSIGADDFLKKPFSRAEVCAHIEKFIGKDLKLNRARTESVKAAKKPKKTD